MNRLLFHRYEILGLLGQGAQSKVYLVRDHLNQNSLKAAKVCKAGASDPNHGEELIREFQILENLGHDHLVRVFDCRLLGKDKTPVLITEFVENSQTFEEVLRTPETLTFADKIQITHQIISALDYLHKHKIIHGDIKPSNILLARSRSAQGDIWTAKLIDFGIAQDLFFQRDTLPAGTPFYLAPEVLTQGLAPASDLYSLGVVLYRLFISPVLPYHSMNATQILQALITGKEMFPSENFLLTHVPNYVTSLIQRLLDPDPLLRPRNLGTIVEDLAREYSQVPVSPSSIASSFPRSQHHSMQTVLDLAGEITQNAFSVLGNSLHRRRSLLFVGAPQGGGKTRFLQELSKVCLQKRWHHVQMHYSPCGFWDLLLLALFRQYPDSQATQIMQPKILALSKSAASDRKQIACIHYLNRLSQELHGLVLMIDSVGGILSTDFFDMLGEIAKRCLKTRREQRPLLSIILTTEAEDIAAVEPIRNFCTAGFAQYTPLPPWQMQDLSQFLTTFFPEHKFSQDFLDHFLLKNRGNPGLIHAICWETKMRNHSFNSLATAEIEERLSDFLKPIDSGIQCDLRTYKLGKYGAEAKTILAFIAACGTCSRTHLLEIGQSIFGPEGLDIVKATLIQALDDRFLQILPQSQHHYTVNGSDLTEQIQKEVITPNSWIGNHLAKLLQGDRHLTWFQHLSVSRFMGIKLHWAQRFLKLFDELKTVSDRMALYEHWESLNREVPKDLWPARDWLRFQVAGAEIAGRRGDYRTAESRVRGVLDQLNNVETLGHPDFKRLQSRSLLLLGLVLRQRQNYQEAQIVLQQALDSAHLTQEEANYGQGFQALCQLLDSSEDPGDMPAMKPLKAARDFLKNKDLFRFANLTDQLGYLYWLRKKYAKAVPYFQHASKLYERLGESSLYLVAQMNLAQAYFHLGNYRSTIYILEMTLPKAERLEMHTFAIDTLALLYRSYFLMGQLNQLNTIYAHLNHLSTRQNNPTGLRQIVFDVTDTYLAKGDTGKALEVVETIGQRLLDKKDEIHCQIGLVTIEFCKVRIYRLLRNWNLVKHHRQIAIERTNALPTEHPQRKTFEQFQILDELETDFEMGVSGRSDLDHLITKVTFNGRLIRKAEFLAFRFAVRAHDQAKVQKYHRRCEKLAHELPITDRFIYHVDKAYFFLSAKDDDGAQRAHQALCAAASQLPQVSSQIARAYFFDQRARLAAHLNKQVEAIRHWSNAQKEFMEFLRSWPEETRQIFAAETWEFQQHQRVLSQNSGLPAKSSKPIHECPHFAEIHL